MRAATVAAQATPAARRHPLRTSTAVLLCTTALLVPTGAAAQSIAQRVAAADPGATVFFQFPAHPDVCGIGEDIMIRNHRERDGFSYIQQRNGSNWRTSRDRLREDCRHGPVRIELTRDDHRITAVRITVGSTESPNGRDLGMVEAAAAVAYLLDDAVPRADSRPADRLVLAAVLADAESWPALLRVARNRELPAPPRNSAIFWLSQQAGDKATAGLTSLIGDESDELEIRKSAVFAMSQIRSEESFEQLLRIARTNPEPEIRKNAIFWLGQSRDPRAIAFFEEILKGG